MLGRYMHQIKHYYFLQQHVLVQISLHSKLFIISHFIVVYSPYVLFIFARWQGNHSIPVHYGKRLDIYVALLDSKGPYFIKNQQKKVVHKIKTVKSTEAIRDGIVLLNTSKTHNEQLLKLT